MPSSALVSLSDTAANAMSVISPYLEEDPCPLDGRFNEAATTELSVKSVFKERFDIPELFTDDVDENEKELQFILESFSKFAANPDHVYQALRSEFLHGNNFNVLLPHLMRYFVRHDPQSNRNDEISVLLRNNKFDYIFHDAPELLEDTCVITNLIFHDHKLVLDLQKYITANPEQLARIKEPIASICYLTDSWFKIALISNMPMMMFTIMPKYPHYVFKSPCIFTGIYIEKEHHSEVFEKINFLIDGYKFFDGEKLDEEEKDFFRLKNLIRYGPEDPNLFEEKIIPSLPTINEYRLFELCHCASLANKMDLFVKLLPHIVPYIMPFPDRLIAPLYKFIQEDSLEMHKFIFDVHANCELLRPAIYEKSNFIRVLSKYYRVAFIHLNEGNELIIEFKIAVDADTSVFPETLLINYVISSQDKLKNILNEMTFDNADILQNFLADLFLVSKDSKFLINSDNLSLIMKSESIRGTICQLMENSIIPRQPFFVSAATLLQIDDLVDFPLSDIAQPAPHDYLKHRLFEFKTENQLRNLEFLLGKSVSTLINSFSNYFDVRHVFDYLIKSGQPLPRELCQNTRELLAIEYPEINLSA